jgi:hypothetical protein
MAKPPPKHRKPLNIFKDEQLAPQGLQGAFEEATRHHDAAIAVQPVESSLPRAAHTADQPQSALPAATEESETRHSGGPGPSSRMAAAQETQSRRTSSKALQPRAASPLPEKNVPFEIRIPQLTKSEFMSFKARLGAALGGVALTDSHIVRALFECLLVQDADFVIEVAEERPRPIKRPANQDLMAQAEFDAQLVGIFREGQQRSRRRRPVPSIPGAQAEV